MRSKKCNLKLKLIDKLLKFHWKIVIFKLYRIFYSKINQIVIPCVYKFIKIKFKYYC